MNSPRLFAALAVAFLPLPLTLHASSPGTERNAPSIEVHWKGKNITLSKEAREQLIEQAQQLVESSNFNSGPNAKHHILTRADVQKSYRKEVAGSYLLVSFPRPQKFTTLDGDVTVSEIVVGLNGDVYVSNLFTIDPEGRVIGHAKYGGELCIEMFNAVKQLAK